MVVTGLSLLRRGKPWRFLFLGGLMLQLIRDAWAGLDNVGRVTLVICLTLVIIAAIAYKVDLGPWLH